MKASCIILAALGCAVFGLVARAGDTRLVFEASVDGGLTYHSNVRAQPGSTVYVQMRVIRTGGATVLGLLGGVYQPTLSSWDRLSGDVILPFSSIHLPNFGTPEGVGVCGKIAPWGVVNQYSSSTASGPLMGHVDPEGILRIAGSNAITPMRNLAWGINTQQFSQNQIGTDFSTSTNCVVFRYGVQLGANLDERTMIASMPFDLVHNQRFSWHTQVNGLNPRRDTIVQSDIIDATIVVPSPGVLGLLLVWGGRCRRRRRVSS